MHLCFKRNVKKNPISEVDGTHIWCIETSNYDVVMLMNKQDIEKHINNVTLTFISSYSICKDMNMQLFYVRQLFLLLSICHIISGFK